MLENLRLTLLKAGKTVNFVAINKRDAVDNVGGLTHRCAYAVLQDLDTTQVWDTVFGGHKDDFYVFGADGKLRDYLPVSGERDTDLSKPEGMKNLRDAIDKALAN